MICCTIWYQTLQNSQGVNVIFPIGSNFPIVPTLHKLLHYDLGNENYFPQCFTVVLACKKLSQRYFISFVDQLVGRALHPSFYRMLVSLCPMNFSASRKPPSKVPCNSD